MQTPPDQRERDQIVQDLDSSMLVEAAAGTGKTTCLVDRMVALVAADRCEVRTLAAVTFTRKAAAELRIRFQRKLESARDGAIAELRERLQRALENIDQCFIGTIHSFCARLLRERPIEAGVPLDFAEMDESTDLPLRQLAWSEAVSNLVADDDPLLRHFEELGLKITSSTRQQKGVASELDELGLEPAELGSAFVDFAQYPDVDEWPTDDDDELPECDSARRELLAYVDHMRSVELPADKGYDRLLVKYEFLPRLVRQLQLEKTEQLMEALEHFEKTPKIVQRNWLGGKEQALAERDRWTQFSEEVAQPRLAAWRSHRYSAALRLFQPARELYDRLRADRRSLNFADLLLKSARLLKDNPGVRRHFRERFTHLLVDEFQDTDPIQAEVMLLLTSDDCSETNWRKCRPAPGALFVVGDPKQSIYRFRRADIVTYGKVRDIIESAGGKTISLRANFRSTPALIDWINRIFAQTFPAERTEFSPGHHALEAALPDCSVHPPVMTLTTPKGLGKHNAVADYEADLIARTIREAIDDQWQVNRTAAERARGIPDFATPSDFMLVARTRTRLARYANALRQRGLPVVVTGSDALKAVNELQLLYLCLRAIVRNDDPVALVSVLRSELFGVSDVELYDAASRGGQRLSLYAEMPSELSDDSYYGSCLARLREYAGWLNRLPTVAAIECIAHDLGIVSSAAARAYGEHQAGGLLTAIELLRTTPGPATTGAALDMLEQIVEGQFSHDGVSARAVDEPCVRVMNLHQAKGLEAPFVFLVDPNRSWKSQIQIHVDRVAKASRGHLAIYTKPAHQHAKERRLLAHPREWSDLNEREQQFLDAEEQRLAYVAATRARQALIVSRREGGNSGSPWELFADEIDEELPKPRSTNETATVDAAPQDDRPQLTDVEPTPETLAQRRRQIESPSYAVAPMKETSLAGSSAKPSGAGERGLEWGLVIHGLLEAASTTTDDLTLLATGLLEAHDLPLALLNDALAAVERVLASELWSRANHSSHRLAEVPLNFPVPTTDSPLRRAIDPSNVSSTLPTSARGVVDLAFRETPGWTIVDYKSERVTETDIPELINYYQPQLRAYAAAWRECTGEPVVEQGLFFTHLGVYAVCERSS